MRRAEEGWVARRIFRPELVFGLFVALQTFFWAAQSDRWGVLLSWDRQGWSWVALLWAKDLSLALAAGGAATWVAGRAVPVPPLAPQAPWHHEAAAVATILAAGIAVRWCFWRWVPPGPWVDTVLLVEPVLRDPGISWIGASYFGDGAMWNRELASHLYSRFADICFRVFGRWDAGFFAVSAVPGCLAPFTIWLLAREAAGPRVALVAVGLASLTRWPVLFSRWAFTGAALVPLAALGAALALRAIRRGSVVAAALSGISFGLALHTHSSAWSVVPVFAALSVAAATVRPDLRRLVASGLLGAALAATPFLLGYLRNPGSLGGRAKDMHLGTRVRDVEVPKAPSALVIPVRLVYNTFRYTGALLWTSDPTPRHSIPGAASFSPLVGFGAVLGLFEAARGAIRGDRSGLVLSALAAGALGAGILSNPEGSPNTLRSCVLVVPALVGAAGVFESALLRVERLGIGRPVSALAGLTFLFVVETLPVMTRWASHPFVEGRFCQTETMSARLYRSLDGAPLLAEPGAVQFPIVLEALAGPESPRTPVPRLPRIGAVDLLAAGVVRPCWYLARRETAERLREAGLRVSRPVAPNEAAPDVVMLRLAPGRP